MVAGSPFLAFEINERERSVSILLADIKAKPRLQGCQDSILLSREGEIAYKFVIFSLSVDIGDDVGCHQSRERVEISHLDSRKVYQVAMTITATVTVSRGSISVDTGIDVSGSKLIHSTDGFNKSYWINSWHCNILPLNGIDQFLHLG